MTHRTTIADNHSCRVCKKDKPASAGEWYVHHPRFTPTYCTSLEKWWVCYACIRKQEGLDDA